MNWILKNVLLAAAILLGLFLIAKVGLDIVTRHNRTVEVPDFTNLTVEEAGKVASKGHVGLKVTDSVFIYRLGAGVVYRQNPQAGSIVKRGRKVFLTINSVEPKKVSMPNLVGYSILEAKAELDNRGLVLGRLTYKPDIATNRVLQQRSRGRLVSPGDPIISGSTIDLTLGLGRSESTTRVPVVVGMKYIAAIDALHDRYLNVGKAVFDPDGLLAVRHEHGVQHIPVALVLYLVAARGELLHKLFRYRLKMLFHDPLPFLYFLFCTFCSEFIILFVYLI